MVLSEHAEMGLGKPRQMEMNLARDVKNSKGFYRYIGQKKHNKETILPVIKRKENYLCEKYRES